MDEGTTTEIPGLILNTQQAAAGGFMPVDIDRQFARYNLPDHGNLRSPRWASGRGPFIMKAGLVDCKFTGKPDD
jgi:hypothetical protein